MDGTIDRKCAIVRVAKAPPGATASPTKVGVTIWVDASPVCPGDDPAITEDVVISVEGDGRRLDAVDFLEFGGIVYGWEADDKGRQFGTLYHDACISGAWMPA